MTQRPGAGPGEGGAQPDRALSSLSAQRAGDKMTLRRERAIREKRTGRTPGRRAETWGLCRPCLWRRFRWCWPAGLGHCQAVSGAEPGVSIRCGKRLRDQVRWLKSLDGSAWPRTQRAGCTTPPPAPAGGCRPGCRAGQRQSPLKPPERWGEDYRLWAQVSVGQGVGDSGHLSLSSPCFSTQKDHGLP